MAHSSSGITHIHFAIQFGFVELNKKKSIFSRYFNQGCDPKNPPEIVFNTIHSNYEIIPQQST